MIGAALKRREDPPLVRGAGRYVDDLVLPHMAFLTILRSPHASARIAGVDTTRAAKLPGNHFARFSKVEILSEHGNLREAATRLFAAMRRLDEAGLDLIVAEEV